MHASCLEEYDDEARGGSLYSCIGEGGKRKEPLPGGSGLIRLLVNRALYGFFSGRACAPALVSREASRRASGSRSDALRL